MCDLQIIYHTYVRDISPPLLLSSFLIIYSSVSGKLERVFFKNSRALYKC